MRLARIVLLACSIAMTLAGAVAALEIKARHEGTSLELDPFTPSKYGVKMVRRRGEHSITFAGVVIKARAHSVILDSIEPIVIDPGVDFVRSALLLVSENGGGVMTATCGPLPFHPERGEWTSRETKGFSLEPGEAANLAVEVRTLTRHGDVGFHDLRVSYHLPGRLEVLHQDFQMDAAFTRLRAHLACEAVDRQGV